MFRSKSKRKQLETKSSSASLSLSSSPGRPSESDGKVSPPPAAGGGVVAVDSNSSFVSNSNASVTSSNADSPSKMKKKNKLSWRGGGGGVASGSGSGGGNSGRRFFKNSSFSSPSPSSAAASTAPLASSSSSSLLMNRTKKGQEDKDKDKDKEEVPVPVPVPAPLSATRVTDEEDTNNNNTAVAESFRRQTGGTSTSTSTSHNISTSSSGLVEEEPALLEPKSESEPLEQRQEITKNTNKMSGTEAFQPALPLPDDDMEDDRMMKRSLSSTANTSSFNTKSVKGDGGGGGTVSVWSIKDHIRRNKNNKSSSNNKKDKRKEKGFDTTTTASTFYLNDNASTTMQKKYTLKDPTDVRAVSELVTYLVPKKTTLVNFMDPSLAFMMTATATTTTTTATTKDPKKQQQQNQRFYNECLFVSRVNQYKFENSKLITATTTTTTTTSASGIGNRFANTMASMKGKKQKLYHVCITRSTNSILDWQHRTMTCRGVYLNGVLIVNGNHGYEEEYNDEDDDENGAEDKHQQEEDEEEDDDDNDDYSLLYNPHHQQVKDVALEHNDKTTTSQQQDGGLEETFSLLKSRKNKSKQEIPPELEQSSFPSLVFFEIYADGTHPEIVQVLDLDQLVAIENVGNSSIVKLVFQNGVTVELDCDLDRSPKGQRPNAIMADDSTFLNKNRFLWSLLQIHAILCTSVVERKMRMASMTTEPVDAAFSRVQVATVLPQVQMRNVDKAELQYIATVNGFLSENPNLCFLLERQRVLTRGSDSKTAGNSNIRNKETKDGRDANLSFYSDEGEENNSSDYLKDEMDDIAYDMLMGNFNRLTIFFSEEEKRDAEEVLNNSTLKDLIGLDGQENPRDVDFNEADTAGALMQLLQKRMRDLEAETCRRLIAWEDGKQYSIGTSASSMLDTLEAQSLSSLFHTLDKLDSELENMEEWLADKAAAIKPLTDECRKVEEVDRQLEQQKRSFDLLSDELERLLGGLELEPEVEVIIKDPSSKLAFIKNGDIDLSNSERGVQEIYNAGKLLKMSFDKVFQEGGIHLRAVNERTEGLANLSTKFCQSVADIIVSVMRRAIVEAAKEDGSQTDKNMNHAAIAKTIRNTQRRFQTSLLSFIKLIELLALLKPSMLTSVRESYADIVSEGILSKNRLKTYFDALPGMTSTQREMYTIDLSNYQPVALRSSPITDPNNSQLKPAQAKGVEIALSEILPVIAREAYFTAALFGLSAKHLSGREKKQNFESAKKSVDYSSRHFKYFITRICGIASDTDDEGRKVFADPMLSLLSSIYLNEAMDNYIDRQRKGGEHSLSLAYVRATILDLRKKVDKQWVAWIEEQIKWVHTNPGVPLNGKRAGIFTSFARFPSYLDHVMICCKVGRPKDQIPNLSRIKVITYYLQKLAASLFNSLHECSERESTDQQYAANVMRMENSYFFTQTIKQRGPELVELFQKQITAASSICKQSTDAYLGFMIKREFKSLHTLFASISRIRREVGDLDVPIHVPKSTFEKTLSKESNKEILKEKIGTIYYRMDKHLSEAGGLLPVAWKALVKVLYEWFGRWEKLSSQCYKFSLEPSASDVVRIAKQAAGISAKKINEEKSRQMNTPLY